MDLRYTPFILFGTSKSGTTWLQKILNAHPEVSCLFQRPIAPVDKKYLVFQENKERVVFTAGKSPYNGLLTPVEEKRYLEEKEILRYSLGYLIDKIRALGIDKAQTYVEYYRKFIDNVLFVENKKACGTKSYSDLEMFLEVLPEGKIVSIVRDPRDVIVSKRFHTLRMGVFFLGDEKSKLLNLLNQSSLFRRMVKSRINKKLSLVSEESFNVLTEEGHLRLNKEIITKYAKEWVAVNDYILKIEKQNPEKILRLRYEDLKIDSEKEQKKVFDFLNVTTRKDILEQISEKTAIKNKSKDSFFRKGIAGDWVNHFDENQLKLIREIAGETAEKLGYKL